MSYDHIEWLIEAELGQRRDLGCDVSGVAVQFEKLKAAPAGSRSAELESLYETLLALPPRSDWPYVEPSSYEGILAARPNGPRRLNLHLSEGQLRDRIYAAWSGRAAGCVLGKPVEGWHRKEIEAYLIAANAWPMNDYVPYIPVEDAPNGRVPIDEQLPSCKGRITRVQRDDDIDYTILGLHVVERFGRGFTTSDVGLAWLETLPYHRVYTAERIAYKNLVLGINPPDTAIHRNPYREWIGAQIRADLFGYINPGEPESAAEMAYRDAALSHRANGIYGEMFVAAAIASAFCTQDIESVIWTAMSEIPNQSRTSEMVRDVVGWWQAGMSWEAAWQQLSDKWGSLSWVHTINNLGLVLLGLLYGGGDYERSICLAVQGGWDTDCNGATVGSIFGAMYGSAAIPSKWKEPLADTVETWVVGFGQPSLTELAARTFALVERP